MNIHYFLGFLERIEESDWIARGAGKGIREDFLPGENINKTFRVENIIKRVSKNGSNARFPDFLTLLRWGYEGSHPQEVPWISNTYFVVNRNIYVFSFRTNLPDNVHVLVSQYNSLY